VLSADALALLSPLLTDARQLSATVAMAGCSLVLLATGGRYRERLHLSALDDLPAIASRLLVATAGVATLVGLRGGPPAVATFLENCATAAVLLVAGRAATMRLIRWRRERGYGVRRTLMMGGGPLAAELADVLDNHPGYGLAVVGFVDDNRDRMRHLLPGQVQDLLAHDLGHPLLDGLVGGGVLGEVPRSHWEELDEMRSGARFSVRDVDLLLDRASSRPLQGWGEAAQLLPEV